MDSLHLTASFRNYLTALRAYWLLVSLLLIVSEFALTVFRTFGTNTAAFELNQGGWE
jgi:hypothetical protein